MRTELVIQGSRPAAEITTPELGQALTSATALLALSPALPVRVTLTQLISELRELRPRHSVQIVMANFQLDLMIPGNGAGAARPGRIVTGRTAWTP